MGTIQADLNELKNLEQKTKNAKAKIDAIPGQLSFSLSGALSELSGVWNGELEGLQEELEKSIREYSEELGRAEQVVSKTYQKLKKADEEALKAMKKDIALNPYTSKMMYMQAGRNYAKESGMPDNIANIIFDAKWEIGYSPFKEVSAQAKATKKEEKGWADYTLEGVSIGADFIPIVSNVKGTFEAGFGMDPFTFRKLNAVEQSIAAGAIVAGPVAKGTAKYGPKVLEAGKNLFKGGKGGGSMMPALARDAVAFSAGGSAMFRSSDDIGSVDQTYSRMMNPNTGETIKKNDGDVQGTPPNNDIGFGRKGWNLKEGGGEIGGRKYSQHALERMAPDTPEVKATLTRRATEKAEQLGYQPQTKEYNNFIKKYVDPRNIPPSVIEDAIKNAEKIPGNRQGTFTHETKDVKVVINENGDIITVIPK